MEFTVYCHEIMSGSDVGLYFAATLEQSKAEVEEYRAALRQIDPTGEPLGTLCIYEMVLRMPDVATMIDLLNSPESLLKTCLMSRKLVGFTVDTSHATSG
ncbi:hypothetical protein [Rhizobium ruizarguesonis]|uniref:hypothetical protein n=1 Tax=Rhizobium ruizarguesonis TaxID=2081791 RepID=UPI0010324AC3|nr:hypothetical protein [Rhizobium ruizarguesonis]TAZ56696.1 hypothetical protein ELH71_09890 [Rhizobium ruizarguesonis]